MKRNCVFLLLLLLALTSVCSIHVSANDCIYTVSGNHLTPLCDTDISVSKEILTISLHDDGYAYVDVYYELQNDGLEKNQTVGFENQPLNYDVSPNIMMSILSKKLKLLLLPQKFLYSRKVPIRKFRKRVKTTSKQYDMLS